MQPIPPPRSNARGFALSLFLLIMVMTWFVTNPTLWLATCATIVSATLVYYIGLNERWRKEFG